MVRALASHQCGRGSNPGVDMWVEFVVGSLLCSERFFSGYSGFPLSPKTNTSKFQFDLERTDTEKRALKLLGASWVNKSHLHFLHFAFTKDKIDPQHKIELERLHVLDCGLSSIFSSRYIIGKVNCKKVCCHLCFG